MRKTLLPLLFAGILGCAEPVRHQAALGTLHTQVSNQCRAAPKSCAALQPCAASLTEAISAWQSVSEAAARGDAQVEAARLATALVAEGSARTTCIVTMAPGPSAKKDK